MLKEFCGTFNFEHETMETAMRLFISSVRLVGESQVLERCINTFANEYFNTAGGESELKSPSVAVTLAYSIMLLHTDLHHKILRVLPRAIM